MKPVVKYFAEHTNYYKLEMTAFTRYLYLKSDAELGLLGALLNSDKERAMFWAYELYFSGFRQETLASLWTIYYGYYFTRNPLLETYMKKKQTAIQSETDEAVFVSAFVSNMVIRKYTTDAALLFETCTKIEEDDDDASKSLAERLNAENYEAIAHAVHRARGTAGNGNMDDTIKEMQAYFTQRGCAKAACIGAAGVSDADPTLVLLARVMHCYVVLKTEKLDKKRNLYVAVDPELVEKYANVEVDYPSEDPYKVFKRVVQYSPNDHNVMSVFKPAHSDDVLALYRSGWVSVAFRTTPLWSLRIQTYGGTLDPATQKIVWENDDKEEEFYQRYWYDTDEHSREIQERNVPRYTARDTMRDFYGKYAGGGLYVPCEEILGCLVGS